MLGSRQLIAALLLVLLLPAAASADSGNGFGIGWQHTAPASGLSLNVPLGQNLSLQPTLALSVTNQGEGPSGHAVYGLRALYDMSTLGSIHPYLGVGVGRSSSFNGDSSLTVQGCQAFLGVEYQLGHLRPSAEIALGLTDRSDGSVYLGTMFNFGLHYYF